MAAQSEAASVKVSPFAARRLRAVLYSTSGRLASWSFLIPAQRRAGAERDSARSLRYRRSRGSAGKNSVNKSPILDDGNSVDKHKLNPLRVLQRLFVGCFINDAIRVEYRNIRIRLHANPSFILEHRRALFQPLRGHERH